MLLPAEGSDCAIARRAAHEVDAFELRTEAQVCHALVADAAVPGYLEPAQLWEMPQHRETAIRDPAARVPTEIELLELWHARQVSQPVVCQLPGSAERETRDVVEPGEPRERAIGHGAVGIDGRDVPLGDDRRQHIPFGRRRCSIGPDT